MGFAPDAVDRWQPWQFAAAWRGWRAAHAPPEAHAPSAEEYRAALARTVH